MSDDSQRPLTQADVERARRGVRRIMLQRLTIALLMGVGLGALG